MVRRGLERRQAARGGARRRLGLVLVLPVPGKTTTPTASCEQRSRRKASEKGQEARGEREETGGGILSPFRALE